MTLNFSVLSDCVSIKHIYILAENIVAKLTWTAVICRICTCCCDCHQAAEGVRLKVKPARAASRSGWKLRFTFGLSIVHVIVPRSHLRIMKLLQNHVQVLHMSRYSLILGHRTFFIYKCILTRTGRRANYQKNIIVIIYLFIYKFLWRVH